MEPYIRMNTEFRKGAKSDFETNFYKLMNNSVFGKTMENLHNRVDMKIIRSWETNVIQKLEASPSYGRNEVFRDTWQAFTCTKQVKASLAWFQQQCMYHHFKQKQIYPS